jgi:hypothetical protein
MPAGKPHLLLRQKPLHQKPLLLLLLNNRLNPHLLKKTNLLRDLEN